jgi:NADPH2:quinone reductase
VRKATEGRGADVIYDTVGTAIFGNAVASLANGGRMVVITAAPAVEVPFDLFSFYRTGGSLLTANSTRADSTWTASLLRELLPGFESGDLPAPDIALRVPLERCAEAFLAVQRGSRGRVVIGFED